MTFFFWVWFWFWTFILRSLWLFSWHTNKDREGELCKRGQITEAPELGEKPESLATSSMIAIAQRLRINLPSTPTISNLKARSVTTAPSVAYLPPFLNSTARAVFPHYTRLWHCSRWCQLIRSSNDPERFPPSQSSPPLPPNSQQHYMRNLLCRSQNINPYLHDWLLPRSIRRGWWNRGDSSDKRSSHRAKGNTDNVQRLRSLRKGVQDKALYMENMWNLHSPTKTIRIISAEDGSRSSSDGVERCDNRLVPPFDWQVA